mgnify:CR=1 FL=1
MRADPGSQKIGCEYIVHFVGSRDRLTHPVSHDFVGLDQAPDQIRRGFRRRLAIEGR